MPLDMTKVSLTYLGSSARLVDPATGLSWEVGESHEVSVEDAERLTALKHEQWDVFTKQDEKAAKAAAEAEKAAARSRLLGEAASDEKETD